MIPTTDIAVFSAALPQGGALLGIDPGEKRIGIAISDAGWRVASPLVQIARGKFSADAATIGRLAEENRVTGLVVGLPLNMDGSVGPSAQAARAFARNLAAALARPALLWDERLSTAAVTRALIEGDASRRRRALVTDKLAAAYILQGALDRLAAEAR